MNWYVRRIQKVKRYKGSLERWKQRASQLTKDTYAIYLACKDPRVPWYTKLFAASVVAYALSPIDLVPDFIPVLGYLDDLVLIPLGIALLVKTIPKPVLAECREKAQAAMAGGRPRNWKAGAVIIVIWLLLLSLVVLFVVRAIRD